MMSPTRPLMPIPFRLSTAAATVAIATALATALAFAGGVHAQNKVQSDAQGSQPVLQSPSQQQAQQGTPKQLLDQKDYGAVLQRGGPVGQYDRAPELALDDAQKDALKRAVLAGDNAQLDAKGFAPAPGADVPSSIKLHPMPATVQQQIPALKYYHFANIADRQIAIVDAMTHKVVDVIAIAPATTQTGAIPQTEGKPTSAKMPSGTAGDNRRADAALNSESGRSGKAEPGAQLPTDAQAQVQRPVDDARQAGSMSQADKSKPADAAKPSDAAPSGTAGDNRRADAALNSESGRSGKAEPGAQLPTAEQAKEPAAARAEVLPQDTPRPEAALFHDGVLNVPGAPEETQTKPAKFSEINNKLDERLIMAGGPGLTDEQAAAAYQAVMADKSVPSMQIDAKPATALPNLTPAQQWPEALVQRHPGLSSYAYVKTSDKVLIVTPANKIVVGWIDANGQNPAANLGQRGAERRGS